MWVAGETVVAHRRRASGIRITATIMPVDDLGETFRFPERRPAQPCGESSCVDLVFLEGAHAGQVIPLARARTVVGRREDADLVLNSRAVSKEHCVLTVSDGVVEIEDLGSTNGVSVNGTRLEAGTKRRLFHGDSVRLAENLAMLKMAGCFQDAQGESRIQIDRAQVAREVEELMTEFSAWARGA